MMTWLNDYHMQWTAVLAGSMLLWCWHWMKPRFGLPAAALLGYLSLSAMWVWAWKDNRYLTINPYDQMALRYFACDSLAKIMIIVIPMMALSTNRASMRFLGTIFCSLFVVGNSLTALAEAWAQRDQGCGYLNCGGLIGNPSISMGLMVCTLPLAVRNWKRDWPYLLLATMAVFYSQSSIAVGLLAAYCILWMAPTKAFSLKQIAWPAFTTAGIFGVARLAFGKELLNDSDRFKIWQFMMERWATPWNIPTGTGLGTYHVLSVNLQQMHGGIAKNMWWNTMHNDHLQMLFECGIVGLLFLLLTYFSAFFKSLREDDWPITISIALFGLYMALDPALHNPLPVLFGAWLFTYVLRKPQFKETI